MNILLIGSGGREHALAWAIKKSPMVGTLFIAPGNAGTIKLATSVNIDISDVREVITFCQQNQVQLVVVGPEAPLVTGLADKVEEAGILVFGPNKDAAQLEGSKAFTKYICSKYNIPTAAYGEFTDAEEAKTYIDQQTKTPIVVKADGLAAGKGVIIAETQEDAKWAIDSMMNERCFGEAGNKVVIEEFLEGEEVSFFALVDEVTAIPFGSAQDHKAVGEGDTGPNTGGMGTYSPAPVMTEDLHRQVMEDIILPLVQAMNDEGAPYKGVVFAGLMITQDGPKLIEINVRFGDPEAQCLMARLDDDIVPLMLATARGDLMGKEVTLKDQAALCVVMATQGYPGSYEKGSIINNLNQAESVDVIVFHAGTAMNEDNQIIAIGGRVLGVTATASSVSEAQTKAYEAIEKIDWPQGFCRRDIGWRAIEREK